MSAPPDLIEEDFIQAMGATGTYIDVLPADLVHLYRSACKYAEIRETEAVQIAEIMTHDVITVAPDVSLAYAAEQLLQHHIRILPVVQRDGRLVGMLTEADVLAAIGLPCGPPFGHWWCKWRQLFSHHPRVEGLTGLVREWMSAEPVTVREGHTLEQVVERMKRHRVNTVIVTDSQRRIRGIVTRSDLMRTFVEHGTEADAPFAF